MNFSMYAYTMQKKCPLEAFYHNVTGDTNSSHTPSSFKLAYTKNIYATAYRLTLFYIYITLHSYQRCINAFNFIVNLEQQGNEGYPFELRVVYK
jgi:hypothetical protein